MAFGGVSLAGPEGEAVAKEAARVDRLPPIRRAARAAWLAAGLATLVAVPASAQGPIQLSSTPIAENPAWESYVLGDGALDATPVRVSSTSGAVSNAQGLVDPSKGPATLTYSGSGPAPTIVLDYGREVGGLPYFNVGAVTPGGGATSVSLRSAYSEAREFLWSYGNTTLSVPAATGDTNIKVGSVANFVVGGTLRVDQEPGTIAAIGTQSRNTTLFSPASAGDTNVKVASTTGIAVGDIMRIDTGGTTESVTVTSVGTQGRNTTLAAAAPAGATNIKLASVTGMSAGDTIHIDTGPAEETRTIASVGTSGADGTGVTLTSALDAAHAGGVAVQDPGTGISFTPALTSGHDAGAAVLALGSGITLAAPLAEPHAAGAPVRGITGALTGDRNGFNGVGVAPSRADTFTLSGPGTVGNAANEIQGGERFEAITLTTPGTVELTSVGIHFRHPNSSSADPPPLASRWAADGSRTCWRTSHARPRSAGRVTLSPSYHRNVTNAPAKLLERDVVDRRRVDSPQGWRLPPRAPNEMREGASATSPGKTFDRVSPGEASGFSVGSLSLFVAGGLVSGEQRYALEVVGEGDAADPGLGTGQAA